MMIFQEPQQGGVRLRSAAGQHKGAPSEAGRLPAELDAMPAPKMIRPAVANSNFMGPRI